MFWHSLPPSSFRQRSLCPVTAGGFGLLELIVTIGIMTLITTVILARHSSFNSAILLRNQAYVVAFSIREIQQQAINVTGIGGQFREVYGMHFADTAPQSYISFRDSLTMNSFYDANEQIGGMTSRLDPRFAVTDIRTYVGNTATDRTALSITFLRPNFDARFKTVSSPANAFLTADRAEIDITLESSGDVRTIEVTRTGQITVQ